MPSVHAASTVIWISIDGFRHDYLQRFHPPELTKLAKEGAYTNQEKPIFPSLTFPNHIAQVTGTTVDQHGIVMNEWYDTKLHDAFKFPDHPEFIRAEPIWVTAERQGVDSAVIDWPMSTNQTQAVRSDFFDPGFDSKETDEHRLGRVIEMLKTRHLPASTTEPAATQPTSNYHHPPRLIMSYCSNVDHIGHKEGPDSPEIEKAVLETDGTIKSFVDQAVDWFKTTHAANDELYIICSTDHGMVTIRQQVNIERLIGVDLTAGVKIVTSGPLACLYFLDVPADQKAERATAIQQKLSTTEFLKCWKANEVPADDHFSDPDRVGDLVILLDAGYQYDALRSKTTRPAGEHEPRGMHGYDPNSTPDLLGSAIIWRLHKPMGGVDLGPIDNTQWEATVCKLLGIESPASANSVGISLPK